MVQYNVCPFCCKVKAFLDFHKVFPQPVSQLQPLNYSRHLVLFREAAKDLESVSLYAFL